MLWCNANFPQPEKKKKKKVGLRKWKEINYTNNVGSYELPYFSPFTCLKTVLTLFRYHQITLSCIFLDQLPLQKYNNAHRSQNNPPTTHMTLHWSHTLLLPHLPNPNTKIIPLPVSYMFLMLVGNHISGMSTQSTESTFTENLPKPPCLYTWLCFVATVHLAQKWTPDPSWAKTMGLSLGRPLSAYLDCSPERET